LHAMHDTGSDKNPRQRDGAPCNWLQAWENMVDPFHVQILHAPSSGVQFHSTYMILPTVEFERVQNGVIFHLRRKLPDGSVLDRLNQVLLPNMTSYPPMELTPGKARGVQWWVPFGDTRHVLFNVQVTNSAVMNRRSVPLTPDGRAWADMTEEEHRDYPEDWEALVGQGPISCHSEEHLARSDLGVVMLRRLLDHQIRIVQDGGDPIGVAFKPEDARVDLRSGNFISPA
jgi:phenylpropionate dioxygenase-like ring-hydroxylating dioxygenase large terminal subunit